MAAVGAIKLEWQNIGARAWTLFAVESVTAGDTADLSQWYRVIKQTSWIGATVNGVANGTFTATVATAPAGLAADGVYLFVDGVPV